MPTHTFKYVYNCYILLNIGTRRDFPGGLVVKSPPASAGDAGNSVWSLGWEDPLEEEMAPTSVFLPGKFHGLGSLVGYSSCQLQRVSHNWATENTYTYYVYLKSQQKYIPLYDMCVCVCVCLYIERNKGEHTQMQIVRLKEGWEEEDVWIPWFSLKLLKSVVSGFFQPAEGMRVNFNRYYPHLNERSLTNKI